MIYLYFDYITSISTSSSSDDVRLFARSFVRRHCWRCFFLFFCYLFSHDFIFRCHSLSKTQKGDRPTFVSTKCRFCSQWCHMSSGSGHIECNIPFPILIHITMTNNVLWMYLYKIYQFPFVDWKFLLPHHPFSFARSLTSLFRCHIAAYMFYACVCVLRGICRLCVYIHALLRILFVDNSIIVHNTNTNTHIGNAWRTNTSAITVNVYIEHTKLHVNV